MLTNTLHKDVVSILEWQGLHHKNLTTPHDRIHHCHQVHHHNSVHESISARELYGNSER